MRRMHRVSRRICFLLAAAAGCSGLSAAVAQDLSSSASEAGVALEAEAEPEERPAPSYPPGALPDAYPDKAKLLRGDIDPRELLVEVPESWASHPGMYAEAEALQAFGKMRAAAAREGVELLILSAFRSFNHQRWIWEAKWRERYKSGAFEAPRDLATHIMRYSSMPGTSRHHWGTDFDINALNNRWFDTPEGKPVYDWMKAHAAEYGFCEVYSARDGRRQTGYEPERWHWSYIPTASRYLAAYVEARDAQPRGFEGDVAAPQINWLTDYVLGINPDCLWTASDAGKGRELPLVLLRAAIEAEQAARVEQLCLRDEGTRDELLAWRARGFELEEDADIAARLMHLENCLGEPDPVLRDEVAYSGIAHILRDGVADDETLRALKGELLVRMAADAADPDGFSKPFAALVLSEVARTDRISPWMSSGERRMLVAAGAAYVRSVRDYRGFIEGEGWRHGLAHGADLLMQLSLNEEIGEGEAIVMARAIFEALMAEEAPALVFDEPARLARPLIILTRRGLLNEAQLSAWLDMLADPAPLESWQAAFGSEEALARRHNVRAFASALLIAASEEEDGALDAVKPGATRLLASVP